MRLDEDERPEVLGAGNVVAALVVHVADARTSVLNPAGTTHRQLTDRQLEEAGIPAGLVRLSVGIEDCVDIASDILQALDRV